MNSYPENWRQISFKAKSEANWTRQRCEDEFNPESGWEIGVHHKNYDKSNSDPSNLLVVCWSCHKKIHLSDDPLFYHCEVPVYQYRFGPFKPIKVKEMVWDVLLKYWKIQRINLMEVRHDKET